MLGAVIIDDVVDEEVDLLARNRLAPVAVGVLDDTLALAHRCTRTALVRNLLTI